MSNIMPQSALNNQGVWGNFEDFCRTQTNTSEVLIICGGSGFGTNKLPSGKASIPSNTWKIAVCVPLGSGTALSRIAITNRVIAISIPNVTNGLSSSWQTYATSPRKVELDTGFTFFTALPANVATVFRAKVDGYPAPSITAFSPVNGNAGGTVAITGTNFTTASTVWFNGTNAAFTVNSNSQITATVPAGATSGQISVVAAGGLATSAANFTVTATNPPAIAPSFSLLAFTNNQFQFTITGTTGSNYVVQAATNLTAPNWIALKTNAAPFVFIQSNANLFNQRFFRALVNP